MEGALWVAVAAVVLSVANLVFLWFNAQATRKHEIRMLWNTRSQQRLETTYKDFVTLMHHLAFVAEQTVEGIQLDPSDVFSQREISDAIGRVKVFGSEAVKTEVDEWASIHGRFVKALERGSVEIAKGMVGALRQQEAKVRDAMRGELQANP